MSAGGGRVSVDPCLEGFAIELSTGQERNALYYVDAFRNCLRCHHRCQAMPDIDCGKLRAREGLDPCENANFLAGALDWFDDGLRHALAEMAQLFLVKDLERG